MHKWSSLFILSSWVTTAHARYGAPMGKVALTHSPNWVMIIVFSIAAIFLVGFIKEINEDNKNTTDDENKRNGLLLMALSIFGLLLSLYMVFYAAFG